MQNGSMGAPTQKLKVALKYVTEGKKFETFEQYKLGSALKIEAGIPLDTELFLSVVKPYRDELIENDKSVNLARPDTEYFFVKKKLNFSINKQQYTWYKQFIRGIQLRELGNISPNDDLFLDIKDGYVDDFITDDEVVDLARQGKEHFFSKHREPATIYINGRPKSWTERNISFDQVINLAENNSGNGNKAYTVTYSKGPKDNPEGELAKGDVVYVTNEMEFNATATDKS